MDSLRLELLRLEDQFVPIRTDIERARLLMDDMREYSVCDLPKGSAERRYFLYFDLLYDVLERTAAHSEAFCVSLQEAHGKSGD